MQICQFAARTIQTILRHLTMIYFPHASPLPFRQRQTAPVRRQLALQRSSLRVLRHRNPRRAESPRLLRRNDAAYYGNVAFNSLVEDQEYAIDPATTSAPSPHAEVHPQR